jgi:Ala-tRNA(Pro) deacylase
MEVVMSIPPRLSHYLEQRGTHYEVCAHDHSHSSAETARSAHLRPQQLAKSVVLEDETGCVLAVLPADRSVKLGQLSRMLGRRNLRLSDEQRVSMVFDDCVPGAVPPVGMAWGIETIVDDELETSEVVYLEGGDHESLLRMTGDQFHDLMSVARHGHFCNGRIH